MDLMGRHRGRFLMRKTGYCLKWNRIQINGSERQHYLVKGLKQGPTNCYYRLKSSVKTLRPSSQPYVRYIECCKVAADFVRAKWENVVLVRNTTQGKLSETSAFYAVVQAFKQL